MRARPDRLQRLPDQYFARLVRRVAEVAADGGQPVVDLGRGNPEQGPSERVVEALRDAALRPDAHGYAPFRGCRDCARGDRLPLPQAAYGVELDPDREVAVVPGTKTAIVELALALAGRGDAIVLPDPYYPDYRSGLALAGADPLYLPSRPGMGLAAGLQTRRRQLPPVT